MKYLLAYLLVNWVLTLCLGILLFKQGKKVNETTVDSTDYIYQIREDWTTIPFVDLSVT